MEVNVKTKLGPCVLHYAEKFMLPGPLSHLLHRWKSLLPTFISMAPFRDISSILCFQRVPLHTACVCVPAISLKYGKGHLPTGPINSQAFTELEFGNSMYSFSVDCKSHSLNWIFLCKVLAKSLFFSGDIQPFKSHVKESRDKNMKKWLLSFLSSGCQGRRVHSLENLCSSESSSAIYPVLFQIISMKIFSLLAMKMLSWHWFWSYMVLNTSWCFCSWAIGCNARAWSDAGWDESLQGACINIAVKKAASSHQL